MKFTNSTPRFIILILAILGLLSSKMAAQATTGSNNFFQDGQPLVISSDIISGTQFNNKTYVSAYLPISTCGIDTNKLKNFATLRLNADSVRVIQPQSAFSVTYRIKVTLIRGNIISNEYPLLTVSYDPRKGMAYTDAQVYKTTGALKIGISVVGTVGSINGSIPIATIQRMLQLSSTVELDQYNKYDGVYSTNFNSSFIVRTDSLNGKPTNLTISWDNSKLCWADEFELEWLYIDDYEDINTNKTINYFTAGQLPVDFSRGATRISLKSNTYELPLVYEHGYLLFRVRGVSRTPNSEHRIVGRWYDGDTDPNPPALVSLYSTKYRHTVANAHETDKKNWQSITTYAEEGLRKDVVSYYDGTLRKRQTVTVSSTDKKAIVAETIYDHQGRPALNILPSPVDNSALRYYNNFNQNLLGRPYSRVNFDRDLNCITPIGAMKADARQDSLFSGASNYYSPFNPNVATEEGRMIPNAGLYPFSVTRFMQDNTGRIAEQSGIGSAFVGDTLKHQTRYFYGTANQEELDRLFGNEVGDNVHYKKNVVQDANGQMSVSYIDADGKTIATALAGAAPKMLDTLESFRRDSMKVDIMRNRYVDSIAGAIIAVQTHTVTTPGEYRFQYDISPKSYATKGFKNLDLCYDCVYDLEISIQKMNTCDSAFTRRETLGAIFAGDSVSRSCDTGAYANVPRNFTRYLDLGTYTVTKKLVVNKQSIDKYVEDYLKTFKTLRDTLISRELAKVDTSGCNITCATCEAGLKDSTLTPEGIRRLVQLKGLVCDTLPTLCELSRSMMLKDMTPPYGQYAKVLMGGDGLATDTLSFFNAAKLLSDTIKWNNPSILYRNADGLLDSIENKDGLRVRPNELTLQQFVDNFKPTWAETLLKYHPEFHLLGWCDSINKSDKFDLRLQMTKTWLAGKGKPSGATNDNFILQSNAQSQAYGNPVVVFNIVNNDPYFNDIYFGKQMKAAFMDSLKNYGNTKLNFLQLAIVSRTCPNATTALQANSCLTNFAFGVKPVEDDTIWSLAVNFYVGEKKQFTQGGRAIHSFVKQRNADCIGIFGKSEQGASTLTGFDITSTNLSPCNTERAALYKFREKRFPGINDVLAHMTPAMKDAVFNYSMDSTAVRQLAKNIEKSVYKDGKCIDCPIKKDWETFINGFLARPSIANTQFVDPIKARYLNRPLFENLNRPDSMIFTRRNANDSIMVCTFDDGIFNLTNLDGKPWVANSIISITSAWDTKSSTEFYKNFSFSVTLPDGTSGGQGRFLMKNYNAPNPCRVSGLPYYIEYNIGDYLKNFPPTPLNPNNNRFYLDKWTVSGVTRSLEFDNFKVLANLMTGWDNNSPWVYDSAKQVIRGGRIGVDYPPLVVYPNDRICNSTFKSYTTVAGGYLEIYRNPNKPYQQIRWNINGVEKAKLAMPNLVNLKDTINAMDIGGNWTVDTVRENGFLRHLFKGGKPTNSYNFMCKVYADSVVTILPNRPYINTDSTENYVEYKIDPFIINTTIGIYHVINWQFGNNVIEDLAFIGGVTSPSGLLSQINYYNPEGNWTYNPQTRILRGRRLYSNYSNLKIIYDKVNQSEGNYAGGSYNYASNGGFIYKQPRTISSLNNPSKPYYFVKYSSGAINKYFYDIPNRQAMYDTLNKIVSPPLLWTVENIVLNGENVVQLKTTPSNSALNTWSLAINPADSIFKLAPAYKSNVKPTPPACALPPPSVSDCRSLRVAYAWNQKGDSVSFSKPLFVQWQVACDTFQSVIFSQNMLVEFMNRVSGGGLEWAQENNWKTIFANRKDKVFGNLWFSKINPNKSLTPLDTLVPKNTYLETCKNTVVKWNIAANKFDTIIALNPSACETVTPKPTKYYLPDSMNSCVNQKIAQAKQIAELRFRSFVDSVRQDVRTAYKQKCLDNVSEVFTMSYLMSEYHYTLYYYDQANNLVKTVPPSGVNIIINRDSLKRIQDYRVGRNVLAVYNNHGLQTNYHYNSLNQVMDQKTPDAGVSKFWYDRLGRLVLSQNAKQIVNKDYSYTKFDVLGRLTEVGEARNVGTLDTTYQIDSLTFIPKTRDTVLTFFRDTTVRRYYTYDNYDDVFESGRYTTYSLFTDSTYKIPYDVTQTIAYLEPLIVRVNRYAFVYKSDIFWQQWLQRSVSRTQITRTYYDVAMTPSVNSLYGGWRDTTNLRNRVTSATYWTSDTAAQYQHATHYGYDIMGNVRTLVQSDPEGVGNKRIDYLFDQLSGKVNKVGYQVGEKDAFYHRYTYDADLRLKQVETSRDQVIWDVDATYKYYRHGPMRRMELGHEKVQGLDYAYTIQGWIKGVNSASRHRKADNGKDGLPRNIHSSVAADAFGYALGYYTDEKNEFEAISGSSQQSIEPTSDVGDFSINSLFNGNIRNAYYNLQSLDTFNRFSSRMYHYDQLNRLKTDLEIKSSLGLVVTEDANNYSVGWFADNGFNANGTSHSMKLSYDPNGNIRTLKRNAADASGTARPMDILDYFYLPSSNKLSFVFDRVPANTFNNDFDSYITPRFPQNYFYDEIGNLTKDKSEGVTNINWNVYGKMREVTKEFRNPTTFLYEQSTESFYYDASGNRVRKGFQATGKLTYYVRDAQGNVMATYKKDTTGADIKLESFYLYGSSRLGELSDTMNMRTDTTPTSVFTRIRGRRHYELSNHLGNVMVVVSDRKVIQADSTYIADLASATDYYAFGMVMLDRNINTEGYRFGFNGKENDNEIKGTGNQQDYGMRIYDPRLGRFLSVDPLTKAYPNYSPYQFAANNPIKFIDLDGEESSEMNMQTILGKTVLVASRDQGAAGVSPILWAASGRTTQTGFTKPDVAVAAQTKKARELKPRVETVRADNRDYMARERSYQNVEKIKAEEQTQKNKALDPFAYEIGKDPIVQHIAMTYLTAGTGLAAEATTTSGALWRAALANAKNPANIIGASSDVITQVITLKAQNKGLDELNLSTAAGELLIGGRYAPFLSAAIGNAVPFTMKDKFKDDLITDPLSVGRNIILGTAGNYIGEIGFGASAKGGFQKFVVPIFMNTYGNAATAVAQEALPTQKEIEDKNKPTGN